MTVYFLDEFPYLLLQEFPYEFEVGRLMSNVFIYLIFESCPTDVECVSVVCLRLCKIDVDCVCVGLRLMFSLMDRVPDGITPMLQDLEAHIVIQGLADMLASASIITTVSDVKQSGSSMSPSMWKLSPAIMVNFVILCYAKYMRFKS